MAVLTFDTLAFAKKLEKHGFSPEQAQVMVELQKETIESAIDNTLATKADIQALLETIQAAREEAKEDNYKLEKELFVVKWVVFATFAIVAIPLLRNALGL